MIDKKFRYGLLISALAVVSGCLTQEAQYALPVPGMPYGLGSLYQNPGYGMPQRGYTAQRMYTSISGSPAGGGTAPRRAYTAAASSWQIIPGGTAGAPAVPPAAVPAMGATCMLDIDQAELNAMQQKAEQMQSEVNRLCAGGRRDEAMRRAIAFGKEMAADKTMQKLKGCSAQMKNNMPRVIDTDEKSPRHICDTMS